jgi:hypothetical protein
MAGPVATLQEEVRITTEGYDISITGVNDSTSTHLVYIVTDENTSSVTITPPSGWALEVSTGDGSSDCYVYAFLKEANTTTGTLTFTASSTSYQCAYYYTIASSPVVIASDTGIGNSISSITSTAYCALDETYTYAGAGDGTDLGLPSGMSHDNPLGGFISIPCTTFCTPNSAGSLGVAGCHGTQSLDEGTSSWTARVNSDGSSDGMVMANITFGFPPFDYEHDGVVKADIDYIDGIISTKFDVIDGVTIT